MFEWTVVCSPVSVLNYVLSSPRRTSFSPKIQTERTLLISPPSGLLSGFISLSEKIGTTSGPDFLAFSNHDLSLPVGAFSPSHFPYFILFWPRLCLPPPKGRFHLLPQGTPPPSTRKPVSLTGSQGVSFLFFLMPYRSQFHPATEFLQWATRPSTEPKPPL